MSSIVWIRGKDLRLYDHEALAMAGPNALCVFVLDPYFFAPERAATTPHRIQFLLDSLNEMMTKMESLGGKLWIIRGRSIDVIPKLARDHHAQRVLALRWTDPIGRKRDEKVAQALDIPLVLLEGETLIPPETLRTQAGSPFRVFSPFARSFRRHFVPQKPLSVPKSLPQAALPKGFQACPIPTLEQLELTRNDQVLKGGEDAAMARLEKFLNNTGTRYQDDRNRMDKHGTSMLSADIKFGVISPRTVWIRTVQSDLDENQKHAFCNELIWREFNHSTLWDNPEILQRPFKTKWSTFPWQRDETLWAAWVKGTTGYPIVDAAQRQLSESGFVHNRARMITASFLTKHLVIDYRKGEAHYLRWLTDGDWAQNNMGWQWAAGCGADAQPWFRIFNPMSQGKKFDPTGAYIRRWVPELSKLEDRFIHAPWTAPPQSLERAGVKLGENYPNPIVDHATARTEYLALAKEHLKNQDQNEPNTTPLAGVGDG